MKGLVATVLFLAVHTASAALAPDSQKSLDLSVMVDFITARPDVAERLERIDLRNFTVHYGPDCIVQFERAIRPRPPGWVGPADPLVFKHNNCQED